MSCNYANRHPFCINNNNSTVIKPDTATVMDGVRWCHQHHGKGAPVQIFRCFVFVVCWLCVYRDVYTRQWDGWPIIDCRGIFIRNSSLAHYANVLNSQSCNKPFVRIGSHEAEQWYPLSSDKLSFFFPHYQLDIHYIYWPPKASRAKNNLNPSFYRRMTLSQKWQAKWSDPEEDLKVRGTRNSWSQNVLSSQSLLPTLSSNVYFFNFPGIISSRDSSCLLLFSKATLRFINLSHHPLPDKWNL